MNLEEIRNPTFFVTVRGYERDQVDAYTSAVADAHQALLDEVHDLRRQVQEGPQPLSEVAAVLRTANDAAAAIVAGAEATAARMRAEAETAAAAVAEEAERRGIDRAVAEIARRHRELRARLREVGDEVELAMLALGEPVDDDSDVPA